MPRYYVRLDELKYYWTAPNGLGSPLVRCDLDCNKAIVYLDILPEPLESKNKNIFKKVKLYLDEGSTVTGYIPFDFYNYIHISNMELLFDGRFNG